MFLGCSKYDWDRLEQWHEDLTGFHRNCSRDPPRHSAPLGADFPLATYKGCNSFAGCNNLGIRGCFAPSGGQSVFDIRQQCCGGILTQQTARHDMPGLSISRFPPPPNNPSETCPRFPTSRHVFHTHTYNMRGEQYSIGALSLIVCVISNTLLVLQHPKGTADLIFYVFLSCDQARPLIPSAPLTVVSPHNVVSCRRAILKGIRQRHEVIIIIITIIIITGWSLQVKSSSSSSSLS